MSTISRALFSALIFSSVVMGQATDSIIAGSVKDPSGAAVVGVTITAVNKQTNVKYTSVTNAAGDYRLNNVPVGLYDVSATAPGFATETVANVKTDLNHTITTNITLQVSAVTSRRK